MNVIADFELQASEFPLATALASLGKFEAMLDRVLSVDTSLLAYVWVESESPKRVRSALEQVEDVQAIRVLDELERDVLCRMEVPKDSDGLLAIVHDTGGELLESTGNEQQWKLRLRFPSYTSLSSFHANCLAADLDPQLVRVHSPGVPDDIGYEISITDAQRETLVTALEAGYFDVPRTITMVELASELGISDTAASQRLRRGLATLVAATLAERAQ
ncbi:helix-turn-helix domain-containing protein [Haloarchaeobius sp. DFWS5]|uniref:helix-turn-helix domain-containing protein n=1 Tax=Haloarchaeobius sp. DFWS5 TaxID=3446114 RepID=UPI003EBB2207